MNGTAGVGGSTVSLAPDYAALLNRQIEVQQMLQSANMNSNLEKTKHETYMAPIRNLRVG